GNALLRSRKVAVHFKCDVETTAICRNFSAVKACRKMDGRALSPSKPACYTLLLLLHLNLLSIADNPLFGGSNASLNIMAEFICRLGTPAGEVITRTIEAPGIHEARAHLEREGFRVFNVAPPKTSGVATLTRFGRVGAHARVKANDFLLFNQQLAALVRAGIPILQAISMLRKRAASARLRAVLGEVEDQIRGGAALSEAFAAQGPIFPRI